jgi:hypothetical protein
MSSNNIYLDNEIDALLLNVKYGNLVESTMNGINEKIYNVNISSKNDESIFIQTSKVNCLQNYVNGSYKLEISFLKDSTLFKCLKDLDKFNIDMISKKSIFWFNKNIPRKNVTEMYKSIIIYNDETDLYSMDINVQINKNKNSCIHVYNNYKQEIESSKIHKGKIIEIILELKGLTFYKNFCYFNFECHQVKICKERKILKPLYMFKEVNDVLNEKIPVKYENYTFEVNEVPCNEVNEVSCNEVNEIPLNEVNEVNEVPCNEVNEVNEVPCNEVNEVLCNEVNEVLCNEVNEVPCNEINEINCNDKNLNEKVIKINV